MEVIDMTRKNISRIELMAKILAKQLTQKDAAQILGVSTRQVKRICACFKTSGPEGLLSKKGGTEPHNKIHKEARESIGNIVSGDIYAGFGPLLMKEKLEERHQIIISKETTRQIMIEYGVWDPKQKKAPVYHPLRQRRAKFGELVQIDGSDHAWFEDRGNPCILIDFIDDATGNILAMKFFPAETTNGYFVTSREHITKYGRPLAYYSDRDSIFKTTRKEGVFPQTQFARAMSELDIAIFCANSPQAKGRVERKHRLFQDRLIKEMRLLGISTIEEANVFLEEEYIELYNERFATLPKSLHDAHRPLLLTQNLDYILAHKATRKVSKNLMISFENTTYQLLIEKPTWEMRKGQITVIVSTEGKVTLLFKEKPIKYRVMDKQEVQAQIIEAKEINQKIINIKRFFKDKHTYTPDENHPFRRGYIARKIAKKNELEPSASDKEKLSQLEERNRKDNLEAYGDAQRRL